MKRIFVIDWILIFVFILSDTSGFGLHRAGHGSSHELWHNWAVFHTLGSVSFLVAIIFHVTTHWGWYKGIIKNGIGRKSKITALLSIVFLLLSVTGIVLLGVTGANSPLGLWHYKMGVIMTVIAIGHIIKQIPALRKSLNTKMKPPTLMFQGLFEGALPDARVRHQAGTYHEGHDGTVRSLSAIPERGRRG